MSIIGLTGSFGSGCSYIGNNYLQAFGYTYHSLSTILKEKVKESGGDLQTFNRKELQDFGNELRRKHNDGAFLVKELLKKIKYNDENIIIDSIKNLSEVQYLKDTYSQYYQIGVFADFDIRWDRVKDKYDLHQGQFIRDDDVDQGKNQDEFGQNVSDCYLNSDILISNESKVLLGNEADLLLNQKIQKYIQLIDYNGVFEPNEEEAIMAMAFVNSYRSSCLQRKVGAIFIDAYGDVFSSGYNEVPPHEMPCKKAFGKCYRIHLIEGFQDVLEKKYPGKGIEIGELTGKKFKRLDYCKSLHAEENAILNIIKNGSSNAVSGSTLYTTTFPCNLCANKLAKIHINKLVYLEPYPQPESKKILEHHGIVTKSFEGVLFNSYFRFRR